MTDSGLLPVIMAIIVVSMLLLLTSVIIDGVWRTVALGSGAALLYVAGIGLIIGIRREWKRDDG